MTDTTKGSRVKEDFRVFLYVLWKHLKLPEPSPVQYDMATYLQHGPRRRMAKAFRGVGKSWMTSAYVLWTLLRNPEARILVLSASKQRADAFVIFCRQLLTDCTVLQHLQPRKGQRDSVICFDVGPSSPAQSPSVMSAGITGQITGNRADLIVVDDVETPVNSMTQLLRDRLANSVKEFDAILKPGGDIIYLGTDQTEMSLYRLLPARGYDVRIWPARIPEEKKIPLYGDHLAPFVTDRIAHGGAASEPLDPKRFDEADLLEREASYGRRDFALQFMLDPSLSDEHRYPLRLRDLIVMSLDPTIGPAKVAWSSEEKYCIQDLAHVGLAGDRYNAPLHVSQEFGEYQGSVMYVDPAGRGADETGYAVVKHLNGKLYLAAAGGLKGGYDTESLQELVDVAGLHKVKLVLVEPNFGDGMFRQILQPLFTKKWRAAVEDAPWSTGQKERRVIDVMEPVLMQHRLIVDRAVIERDLGEDSQYQLMYQLTRITRERGALRHDDRIEAVAGAVSYWVDQMAQSEDIAYDRYLEDQKDQQVREFLDELDGRKATGPTWNTARGLPPASHRRRSR